MRLLLAAAAIVLSGLPLVAATDPAKSQAQELLDKAVVRQKAYDRHFIDGDYVRALKEMEAAMKLYTEGARRFPDNTAFHFGLGVLYSVQGHYREAVDAFAREREILKGFDDPTSHESKYLTALSLAESYEHLFQYDRAIELYREALQYRSEDAKAKKALGRCVRLRREFAELPKWIAASAVPEGTAVDVVYDLSPRSYPGYRQTVYRLEFKGGKTHAYLEIPLLYRGQPANRQKVAGRLKQGMALVEECFRRSHIHLHIDYELVRDGRALPDSRGVTVWDHYRPSDLRMGDERNWAILSGRGLSLSAAQAASTVAHEVGHMLGLSHPPYYPDEPYTDVMTAGRPWASVEVKRVFPGDAKMIVAPLLAPKGVRGVLGRARQLTKAGNMPRASALLADACQKCPQDVILHLSYANALFDLKKFSQAAQAYSQVLRLAPQDYRVHFFRGVALSRAGKYQEAIRDFTLIVAQHSGGLHAAAYHERAIAYEKLGQHDKARADHRKSREAIRSPKRDPEAVRATAPSG